MAKKTNINSSYQAKPVITRSVTDYLNTDYRQYTKYVISTRALPSIVDGFKTGARKVMHAAFNGGLKNGSECKVLNLTGDIYNLTLYPHGDASLYGTIFTEAAEFTDNLNPLTIIGQHGSLRDPKALSAPRYLYVKLNKYAKLYKVDEDLLEYVFDEGQYIEPVTYFPIIPTVLTSRNEGMAPGYKFMSFSYNPLDIIDACIEKLKTGKIKKTVIRPFVRGIDPESFIKDEKTGRWLNKGSYKVDVDNDLLQITDLPYNVSFDKIEKALNSYIDSGFIKDWKTYSHDNIIDYKILFHKTALQKELRPEKKPALLKKMMLETLVPEDLLYVLDENDKVKKFDTPVDLTEYFVEMRLQKYNDRKSRLIEVLEQKLKNNSELCRFIELVVSGKLVIAKRPIKDVKTDMAKEKLPEKLLQTAISKLTEEERQALLKTNEEIKAEIEYINKTTIEQMYINDLKALKKELSNDGF